MSRASFAPWMPNKPMPPYAGSASLQAREQLVRAVLAELSRALLHLPERELAQRREEQAADRVADAEELRRRLGRAGAALGDDRRRVEAVLVRARRRGAAARVEAGFGEERRVGAEQGRRRRRRAGLLARCVEDGADRRARARRVGDARGPGADIARRHRGLGSLVALLVEDDERVGEVGSGDAAHWHGSLLRERRVPLHDRSPADAVKATR